MRFIFALILACEIAFWVFILAGLVCRYLLGWRKAGAVLLLCTPVIDLLLLAFTVIDLRGGATADWSHSLAGIYIGVSLAFGHSMIRWADEQFSYRFAKGPPPPQRPKHGKEHARLERQGWLRHLLAFAIGAGSLYAMIILVDNAARTESLSGVIGIWFVVLIIDFIVSFSYTFWPRPESKKRNP